jgi:hypothetical protein
MLELRDGTALGDETGRRPKLSEADTKCNPSYKNRILTLVSWSAYKNGVWRYMIRVRKPLSRPLCITSTVVRRMCFGDYLYTQIL